MMDLHNVFAQRLDGSLAAIASLRENLGQIVTMAHIIRDRLAGGGTLYTCGNGGSAAQALHLAEELTGRYRESRPPFRAVCLNADPTALTCIANDFGFQEVFARQCEALLTSRDALLAFSTSGESPNIVRALQMARQRGAAALALLGRNGGVSTDLCDHAIIVRIADSAHVQEAHQVIMHMLCEALEQPAALSR